MSWITEFLSRNFVGINEPQSSQQVALRGSDIEIAELRKEVAQLSTRIAVLEEARKTMASDMKLALVETVAAWETKALRERIAALEATQPPTG